MTRAHQPRRRTMKSRDAPPSASCGERSPSRGGPIDSNLTAHFCTCCVGPRAPLPRPPPPPPPLPHPLPTLFKLRFSLEPASFCFLSSAFSGCVPQATLQMPSTPPIQLVTRFLHSTEIWAFATKYGSQFPFFPFVASVSLIAHHRRGDTDLCALRLRTRSVSRTRNTVFPCAAFRSVYVLVSSLPVRPSRAEGCVTR